MFFLKSKSKSDEILPPPPPFPAMEFEEEPKESEPASSQSHEKPKFFDEILEPEKAETFPEEDEFGSLVKEVEALAPKKTLGRKEKSIKKAPIQKQQKVAKIKPKQLKKIQLKQVKKEKISPKKLSLKPIKKQKIQLKKLKAVKKAAKISKTETKNLPVKQKIELPKPKEDFGLKNLGFELPKELEKDAELPDTLEDFDIEDIGKELGIESDFDKNSWQEAKKPNEILEAQEEIKSAIEKIKSKEKPSFLNRLFAGREPENSYSAQAMDRVSIIQNRIKRAKEALDRLDLEAARRNYIEIMKVYNNINPEEQAKVYRDIRELYFERKSAEELKV